MNKHKDGLSFNQQQAFDLVHEWFASKPETPFVLRGYAGTGKSFSVQRIIKSLQEIHSKTRFGKQIPLDVALCAPTHKARHVLDAMAQGADLKVDVSTLHSLLHLMPGEYDEAGNRRLKINTAASGRHYSSYDLVVVDESSMIGNELLSFIPKDTPTVFMGDPAQLPPVEDGIEESPIFSEPTGIELTQVMRYEGAIADYVTALRQDLTTQFPPRLNNKGNITKLKEEDWLDLAIAAYKDDKSVVKILAWTNNRVNALNKEVRRSLYPNSGMLEEGEILFAKETIMLKADEGEKKQIFMHSCAECTVIDFKEYSGFRHQMVSLPFKAYRVNVEDDMGKEATLLMIHEDSWELIKESISNEKKRILAMDKSQRKHAWREFYEFLELYNLVLSGTGGIMHRLQYGYAITVHQSQGGTFPYCFVDTGNIYGCKDNVMRNKLLYVAYSRASKELFCCSKY